MKLQDMNAGSFYGDYLYDAIVAQDHFLRLLRDLVPWQRYTYRLIKYYRGKGERGRPPIDPAIVLKMLILSYLYNVSERQVTEFCRYNLAAKYFLGLAIDAPVPNHSTLTVFKKRILRNGKIQAYERLLRNIIADAQEAGIVFGPLQIVDSTHTVADVDPRRDKKRRDNDEPPHEPDARWGCKGSLKFTDDEGEEHEVRKFFYGFKMHASMNAQSQMITSLITSTGNRPDGKYLVDLIENDLAQGLPVSICAADRGYDDTHNHFWLTQHQVCNAIHLLDSRTKKKDANKDVWIELKAQPWYRPALDLRYQIERKFGEAKRHHGLARCRYRGWKGFTIQSYLTAYALNFKQLVRGLTGATLRGPALIRT